MSCCAASGALSNAFFTAGSSLSKSKALAGLDADPLHLRDDRLVRDVGRVQLEEFGRVGEVFSGRHGIDLNLRRRLHIDARVNRAQSPAQVPCPNARAA